MGWADKNGVLVFSAKVRPNIVNSQNYEVLPCPVHNSIGGRSLRKSSSQPMRSLRWVRPCNPVDKPNETRSNQHKDTRHKEQTTASRRRDVQEKPRSSFWNTSRKKKEYTCPKACPHRWPAEVSTYCHSTILWQRARLQGSNRPALQ